MGAPEETHSPARQSPGTAAIILCAQRNPQVVFRRGWQLPHKVPSPYPVLEPAGLTDCIIII